MVLLSRRGADSSLAAREAGRRSTLLLMVRIGELEIGDVHVPVAAECNAEGTRRGRDVSRRLGYRRAAGRLREVVAGRVELVRRDPTRRLAWMDGPS